MIPHTKNHIILYSSLLISAICYYFIAFHTLRTDHLQLFSLVGLLFGCLAVTYYYAKHITSLRFWFNTAVILRCIFLFSTPTLSDDYYRFAWDGHVVVEGYNPYQFTPIRSPQKLTMEMSQFELLSKMNSLDYYSVYPPVLQAIFAATSYASGDNLLENVMLLKLFILIFECISLYLLFQLLNYLKQPPERWLLYALNPLIIIELIGNVHFEAVMITGLLATFYFLTLQRNHIAAVCFTLAIGAKLLPLIILPLIWVKLGWKKGFIFATIVGLGIIVMFLPFISMEMIHHMSKSLNLYFQTFEFNASLYYIFRWLGFQWSGYNMIATIGIINAVLTLGLILWVSFRKKENWQQTLQQVMMIMGIYLLFSSIVHPWYIASLLLFSVFTQYRFTIVWSAVAFLSYYTYQEETYTENMALVAVEYLLVAGFLIYEIWRLKKTTHLVTNHIP